MHTDGYLTKQPGFVLPVTAGKGDGRGLHPTHVALEEGKRRQQHRRANEAPSLILAPAGCSHPQQCMQVTLYASGKGAVLQAS